MLLFNKSIDIFFTVMKIRFDNIYLNEMHYQKRILFIEYLINLENISFYYIERKKKKKQQQQQPTSI
jgi:hypothetical protein